MPYDVEDEVIYVVSNGEDYSNHVLWIVEAGDVDLAAYVKRLREWLAASDAGSSKKPSVICMMPGPATTVDGNYSGGPMGLEKFTAEVRDAYAWLSDEEMPQP